MPATSISAELAIGEKRHTVELSSSDVALGDDLADACAAMALLPAMRAAAPVSLPDGVSPRLLARLPAIQEVVLGFDRSWRSGYQAVEVTGRAREPVDTRAAGVGCLFTGGADSFYSLSKHRGEITHLIFVHGFDIALDAHALRAQASATVRAVADRLDIQAVEIETDAKHVFVEYGLDWFEAHGAALAGVALLLQDVVGTVIVPSTYSYGHLPPCGSHPLLDPLWSTERTRFVHDGCEATRPEKLTVLASDDLAMDHLRVCWENRDGLYNCGRCEKCVRTMVNLRIAGALERCRTFPDRLDLAAIAAIPVYRPAFLEENLDALAAMDEPDRELEAALREAQRRSAAESSEQPANSPEGAELDRLRRERDAILGSRSWRLTAPLRKAAGFARRPRPPAR